MLSGSVRAVLLTRLLLGLCLNMQIGNKARPPYSPIPVTSFWYKRSAVNSTCDATYSGGSARPLYVFPFRDAVGNPALLVAGYSYCSESNGYSSEEPAQTCARPPESVLSFSNDGGQTWECAVSPLNLPSSALRTGAATFSALFGLGMGERPQWLACIVGGQVINRPQMLRTDIMCASSTDSVFRTAGSVPVGITRATVLVSGPASVHIYGGLRDDNSTYIISCTVSIGDAQPFINCNPQVGALGSPPWGVVAHPLVLVQSDLQGNGDAHTRIVVMGGAIPVPGPRLHNASETPDVLVRANEAVYVCQPCDAHRGFVFSRSQYGLSAMLLNNTWDAGTAAVVRWGGASLQGSPFYDRCHDPSDPSFGCAVLFLQGGMWLSHSRHADMDWSRLYQLPPTQGLPRDSPIPIFTPSSLRYVTSVTDHVLPLSPVLLGVDPLTDHFTTVSPFACAKSCPVGFIHNGCTVSPVDAQCVPCTPCLTGITWQRRECELKISREGSYGHDTLCSLCSACDPVTGLVVEYACNSTHNTVCQWAPVTPVGPGIGGNAPPSPVVAFSLVCFFGVMMLVCGLAATPKICSSTVSIAAWGRALDYAVSLICMRCCIWFALECSIAGASMPWLTARDATILHAWQGLSYTCFAASIAASVRLWTGWERCSEAKSAGLTFYQARAYFALHRSLLDYIHFLLMCFFSVFHGRAMWHAVQVICRTVPVDTQLAKGSETTVPSAALVSARTRMDSLWFRRTARYGSLAPELVMVCVWSSCIYWAGPGSADVAILRSWKEHLRQVALFSTVLCVSGILGRLGKELVPSSFSPDATVAQTPQGGAGDVPEEGWEPAQGSTGTVAVNAFHSVIMHAMPVPPHAVTDVMPLADRGARVALTRLQGLQGTTRMVGLSPHQMTSVALDEVSLNPLHERALRPSWVGGTRAVLAPIDMSVGLSEASLSTTGSGQADSHSPPPSVSDRADLGRRSMENVEALCTCSEPRPAGEHAGPGGGGPVRPQPLPDTQSAMVWTSGADPRPLVHAALDGLRQAAIGQAVSMDNPVNVQPTQDPAGPAPAADLRQLHLLERALQQLLSTQADTSEDSSTNRSSK